MKILPQRRRASPRALKAFVLVLWVFSALLCASAVNAFAQELTAEPSFQEITPDLESAVERGLLFLARQQQEDGSFDVERYGNRVGITALAGIAFLAHGDLPGRGRYGHIVEKALRFTLKHVQENGLIAADTSHGPMYGHGFATLFLAEVYGQTNDVRTREALLNGMREKFSDLYKDLTARYYQRLAEESE